MVTERDITRLEDLLARRKGLGHLRVRKRADSLVLYSGKKNDEVSHAKLTALGPGVWGLSLPRHTGRWERTPFVGTIDSVLSTLIETLGFHLDPRR